MLLLYTLALQFEKRIITMNMIYFIIIFINDKVKHIANFLINRNYGIYVLLEAGGRLCIHISLMAYLDGGRVKGNRVVLAKNKHNVVLNLLYSLSIFLNSNGP